jgi:hypothetical protein
MTEKSRVPRKLSLAGAYRRVAAKFRRSDHRPSEDYLRYERNAEDSGQARLMREEAAGQAMRDFGAGGGIPPF